jgi:hypothetical protein
VVYYLFIYLFICLFIIYSVNIKPRLGLAIQKSVVRGCQFKERREKGNEHDLQLSLVLFLFDQTNHPLILSLILTIPEI